MTVLQKYEIFIKLGSKGLKMYHSMVWHITISISGISCQMDDLENQLTLHSFIFKQCC